MNLRLTRLYKYYFWAGLSLVLIFTVLKPAGTENIGLFSRVLVWTIQVGLLLPILVALHISLQSVSIFDRLNPWFKLTLSGVLGSTLFVPFGLGIDYLFELDDWTGVTHFAEVVPVVLEELKGIIFPATLTWIAINAPRVLQLNFKEIDVPESVHTNSTQNETRSGVSEKFLSLIPSEIGHDIIYLRSELHYVRVVTPIGESLLLFSLKDAVDEMEKTVAGIRTHRSYWVSSKHINSLISEGKNKYILTSNNQKVPVSRRKLTHVKHFMQTVIPL
ncbi:MAG: LytTR family DNA-binding domain-containing protein [Thermodesulfobacteriota bacterium]|nr:LytTR family DNA-binding domain-containing protein [Thermodesulfobacteriota bacterium]